MLLAVFVVSLATAAISSFALTYSSLRASVRSLANGSIARAIELTCLALGLTALVATGLALLLKTPETEPIASPGLDSARIENLLKLAEEGPERRVWLFVVYSPKAIGYNQSAVISAEVMAAESSTQTGTEWARIKAQLLEGAVVCVFLFSTGFEQEQAPADKCTRDFPGPGAATTKWQWSISPRSFGKQTVSFGLAIVDPDAENVPRAVFYHAWRVNVRKSIINRQPGWVVAGITALATLTVTFVPLGINSWLKKRQS